MKKIIDLYGAPRSGTKYFEWLLNSNFKGVEVNANGKHQVPPAWTGEHYAAIIIKDPFAWSDSMMNMVTDATKVPFDCSYLVRGVIGYAELNAAFYDLTKAHPDRCWMVRYEDLLADLDAALTQGRDKLGLTMRGYCFVDQEWRVPDGNELPEKRFDKRDYFLERGYMAKFTGKHVADVRAALAGSDVVAKFYGGLTE